MAVNISTAEFESSKDISATHIKPDGIGISPDGDRMFTYASGDIVYQWDLSTAFDVSTATHDSVTFDTGTQIGFAQDLVVRPTGERMYALGSGSTGFDNVAQYDLSTAWDLSTAAFNSVNVAISSTAPNPVDMDFSPDGSRLYIADAASVIYQFNLSTAWDVDGMTYSGNSFDYSGLISTGTVVGLFVEGSGKFLYLSHGANIRQFQIPDLSDISTLVDDGVVLTLAEDNGISGATFSDDQSFMFVTGRENDSIYQYAVSPDGPTTNQEKFNASYADASAADPKVTALIRPADVQRSIDTDVSNLKDGPNFYTVEAIFDIGELSDLNPYNPTTEKPRVFFVKDDQPGLRDGKNLLLKGYQIRSADPSVPVTCTFWGY